MNYLDQSTLDAIEQDLAAAHESLAHGDLSVKGAIKTGIKILEVVVPAALFSYGNARSATGEMLIAGKVPVDLGVGVGLALLSLFDVAGDWDEDLLNVALGGLTSYAARTGAAFGAAAGPWSKTATATAGIGHMAGQASMPEISGARSHVPPGTQRFAVRRVA